MEAKEFLDSTEKLDGAQYSILTTFYSLCESKKSKSPPNDHRIYEEFLTLNSNSRLSLSKDYQSSGMAKSLQGIMGSGLSLLSPMRKASIHSPRHLRKVIGFILLFAFLLNFV